MLGGDLTMTTKPLSDRYISILNNLYGFNDSLPHIKFIPSVSFFNENICFPISRDPLSVDDLIILEEAEAEGHGVFDLKTYIDSFSIEVINDVIKFCREEEVYFFTRAYNENVRHLHTDGVYSLNSSDGNQVLYFSALEFNVRFNKYFWLLALFLLEQDSDVPNLEKSAGWPAIYEKIGPFIVSNENNFVDCDLYRHGIFTSMPLGDEVVQHQWKGIAQDLSLSSPKQGVPLEAVNAYKEALRISTTVDLSYINLFKVIEVLYAWGLKEQVNLISLDNIYNALREGSVTSELSMVKYIRQASGVNVLSYFTRNDFKKLFPLFESNKPQNYKAMKKWLDGNGFNTVAINSPKDDIKNFDFISEIFYYVRCALVHSKLDASAHSIRAPYSKDVYIALNKMVHELRHMIDMVMY